MVEVKTQLVWRGPTVPKGSKLLYRGQVVGEVTEDVRFAPLSNQPVSEITAEIRDKEILSALQGSITRRPSLLIRMNGEEHGA